MGENENTITSQVIEVGDCDGCGVPMVDATDAALPGAEPPPGMTFLGMAYATRGTPRCKLCEDCFAKGLVWAAKAARGEMEVGD